MRSADEEFRRQCERSILRGVDNRIRFGWFRNPNPVKDLGVNRAFETMEAYRRFCEENYPEYYGYARPAAPVP
ncbi:MAG: hypothetical protein HY017_34020 [Betaproteobacteria bacterium]|nr:hypothetical protein [Betaproteobacteria bacterium]